MDQNLLCFVILSRDDKAYQACISHLKKLITPIGLRVQYMRVGGPAVDHAASAYQAAMTGSPAKYKVYIDERVTVTNRNFLGALLTTFQSDSSIGIVDVLGYPDLPFGDGDGSQGPIGAVSFQAKGSVKTIQALHDRKAATLVRALAGILLATQYDILWRVMFQSAGYAALSASLEFQRRGYRAAVLPQEKIWCTAERGAAPPEDESVFRLEYAPEIWGEFFVTPPGRQYHPHLDAQFDGMRGALARCLREDRTEDAIFAMQTMSRYFVQYNQFFRDETIEEALRVLSDRMNALHPEDVKLYEPEEKCILFLDCICFDTRGLACIYLKALAELGYRILYIAPAHARGRTPILTDILENAPVKAEIVYIDRDRMTDYIREVCATVQEYRPARGILYNDAIGATGALTFMRLKGLLTRFFIDLGDHAYWIGADAFDFCLEFRNWGASVSRQYRRIPKEKLLIQPYYPIIDHTASFQGFPFQRSPGDFVVFSGGLLYKTFDDAMTYYRTVAWMLRSFPQVKFWYAGKGDDRGLRALREEFPGRVFHTEERRDLFQVMENIDMYLNTYPIGGGLMMQYSALAGKPPLSLDEVCNGLEGVLLHQEDPGIRFSTEEEWQKAIERFITDPGYRLSLQNKMRRTVISPQAFRENLAAILSDGNSAVETSPHPMDLTAWQRQFFDEFTSRYAGPPQ